MHVLATTQSSTAKLCLRIVQRKMKVFDLQLGVLNKWV